MLARLVKLRCLLNGMLFFFWPLLLQRLFWLLLLQQLFWPLLLQQLFWPLLQQLLWLLLLQQLFSPLLLQQLFWLPLLRQLLQELLLQLKVRLQLFSSTVLFFACGCRSYSHGIMSFFQRCHAHVALLM